MLTVLRENQLCKTSTRHQKNSKQSRIVVLASCFAIIVAHQYGVTNREALLKNNPRTLYFNFWTKFPLRDGSLEKLREKWGIFEPDELFSVNIYLAWMFLGLICVHGFFFHFILPYANIFFLYSGIPPCQHPFFDHLVITTIFFRPKRKKSLSHFIILKTPIMLPPRYYDQDFFGPTVGSH